MTVTVHYVGLSMGAGAYIRALLSSAFEVPESSVVLHEVPLPEVESVIAERGLGRDGCSFVVTWREVRELMRKVGR